MFCAANQSSRNQGPTTAIGDLTSVELVGVKDFRFHLMHWYCDYRGLDNMLFDLYDEPEMVHDVMRFFTEGAKSMMRQYEEQNLISLNNDGTFHYTGGVGYNDQLHRQRGRLQPGYP